MNAHEAATAWVEGWQRGWRAHDADAIAALYAEDALYLSHPFRDPERSARDYALRAFGEEELVEVEFGEPIVEGDLAAVEYWAILRGPQGNELTLAGIVRLRFGSDGRVAEHREYWAMEERRREPPWRTRQ